MKYDSLARDIIRHVGGKENVIDVVHCVTRLRFRLKDEGKADTERLKAMDGVVTVIQSGGQYQVVIGNQVAEGMTLCWKPVDLEMPFRRRRSRSRKAD